MKAASTRWRETIGADEDARFRGYGEQLVELSRRAGGRGRALHRNQRLGLRATFEVLPDLPPHARHGIFASPRRYDARIRLSNGSGAHAPDRRPDVRGFAVRVLGVDGPGALGGATQAQCFLFINSAAFAFPTAAAFMNIVVATSRGPLALLRELVRQQGVVGALRRVRALARPFAGFARETFHSAAPIACGPYAAKLRLVASGPDTGPPARRDDWSADVAARLATGDLTWDVQLQFFVDEATTPIEDPTVAWAETESPFVTAARLVAPAQDPRSTAGEALAQAIEAAKFDPWVALADHRPLGEIMRARKATYFASQEQRGASDTL